MENNKPTIFCGSGKQTHETFLNIALCLSDIPKDEVYEFNGKKYVNITAVKKKAVDEYGKTHFVKINDYVSNEGNHSSPVNVTSENSTTANNPYMKPSYESDLPF
jgi:hypothetical protein